MSNKTIEMSWATTDKKYHKYFKAIYLSYIIQILNPKKGTGEIIVCNIIYYHYKNNRQNYRKSKTMAHLRL